jgi:hypothetical protein
VGSAALPRGSDSDETVLRAAFSEARRLRSVLLALKAWQPPLDGNIRSAESAEQKILDNYLADWQDRFPDVAVTSALRPDEPLASMVATLGPTDLLVLGLLDLVILAETHCSMLVPACDRVPAAARRGTETRTVPTRLPASEPNGSPLVRLVG